MRSFVNISEKSAKRQLMKKCSTPIHCQSRWKQGIIIGATALAIGIGLYMAFHKGSVTKLSNVKPLYEDSIQPDSNKNEKKDFFVSKRPYKRPMVNHE